jgi:ligand-binding SRPBCC domain-containing protein/ribosomal protein S18 acetylase RimI-like enzyme
MKLRRATETDVPALVDVTNAAYLVEAPFVEGPRIDAAAVAAKLGRGTFLVADEGTRMLGCVFVDGAGEPGRFGPLSVHPDVQGMGVGRRLVAFAEARLAAAGRQEVEIDVVSQRPELFGFYEALGYAPTGERRPFPDPERLTKPCDLVVLRRRLSWPEVRFSRHRGDFVLDTHLFLDRPLAEVFPFFAEAANLDAITPPWLRFRTLTPPPIEMRRGAIIDYGLKLHGFPIRWQSEITAYEPPHRFVDEQRRGPYRSWRHEHLFVETDGGTLVEDRVRYSVPGGGLVHALFVRGDLRRTFEYRQRQVRARLG